ncbi:hypothetical protein [Dactylosporangium matsuzakiense]|uniref:hypothetical protein n=1 Tax=Dactylosporangium matsuzakiense TaxID=53360 RepID=UPI0021C27431|nr:hypothetical protein [Dactylosporangium matsuzakiense]UWZ46709.1 hypothetical protein Dmats_09945 [Dactylosporangium matsuzakiense]
MTPRRFGRYVTGSKAAAVGVAAVIVVLRVLYEFGVTPSNTPLWLAVALLLAPIFVLSAAFIVFGIVFRPLVHPPPAALRVRGDAFVVPGSPILMGRLTMGWALLGTVFLESDPTVSPTTRFGINAGAALVIAGAIIPLLRGPRIVVSPAGLNIRAGGRRILAWDDLVRVPANPLPMTVRAPKLALSIRRPGRTDPGWLLIPLELLAVEPVFLGSVVEHYVEHPDRRGAIGTAEEYTRLTGVAA